MRLLHLILVNICSIGYVILKIAYVVVHFATTIFVYKFIGTWSAVITFFTPPFSEIWWAILLWWRTGEVLNIFSILIFGIIALNIIQLIFAAAMVATGPKDDYDEEAIIVVSKYPLISNNAQEFIDRSVANSSINYKDFIEKSTQMLVDRGMTIAETERFVQSDNTKIAYAAGLIAEQLLAARNVMGEETGHMFESAVFERLNSILDPKIKKLFGNIPDLLTRNRLDPKNARVGTLQYMLKVNKLDKTEAARKLKESSLFQLFVNATMLQENICTLADLAVERGLATNDWLTNSRLRNNPSQPDGMVH